MENSYCYTTSIESKKRPEVDNGFKKLVESKKWILSTGTIVEDKLYSFGKTCFSNHPSQSLILDLNDLDIYVKSEVFTPQGIEEIKTYRNAGMGKELPDDFKKYLKQI